MPSKDVHVSSDASTKASSLNARSSHSLLHAHIAPQHQHCALQAVGIDKSESQINRATARFPHIPFHQVDAWDISSVISIGKQFTKVFIDVSGNRSVGDVEELLSKYDKVFSPELFVVKCFKLKRLLNRCQQFS